MCTIDMISNALEQREARHKRACFGSYFDILGRHPPPEWINKNFAGSRSPDFFNMRKDFNNTKSWLSIACSWMMRIPARVYDPVSSLKIQDKVLR